MALFSVLRLPSADLQDLAVHLLSALQVLPVARLLRSSGSGKNLFSDIGRLYSVAVSDDFDLDHIKPLLHAVLTENTNDALIWTQVYAAVAEFTPPPRTRISFDPTIVSSEGKRYIEIERNGKLERLIIDQRMRRAPCMAGRATTCWRAHREGDNTPLVIKDSWQYPEREEEGKLLQEATAKGVVNVARYYHHETVRVRSSNCTDPPLSPSKRPCSTSPINSQTTEVPNRVHRRIVLRDFGKAIYKASSRASLLAALDGCIEGHESLRMKAGILQRDISINNLLINEGDENPSWRSFLIDLDLAIKEQRQGGSGAREMTGTRAFMAIGVLMGEQHSFMHDLESFFWVLYWICIHFNGPNHSRVVDRFDQWNYLGVSLLADVKRGHISDEADFIKAAEDNFTQYYQPLIPWVNRLRKVVFPNGKRWKKDDESLYTKMKKILREAQEDPDV